MSNQLAVLFPGIGYHIDKPLLYYSAKLARARGCDLLAVQYPALPTGLRGHAEKIEQAVQTALSAAEEQLTTIDWTALRPCFLPLEEHRHCDCRTVCCSAQHSSAAGILHAD